MNPILVIGATGTVGRQVVSRLAATGTQVRAMARNPVAARLPRQVEVVCGDLTLPETLDGCFDGIDTVFLVWTAPPAAVAPALERITKQAQRIVFLSAPLKTAHPLFQQPNPLRAMFEQIERLIETSGLPTSSERFPGRRNVHCSPEVSINRSMCSNIALSGLGCWKSGCAVLSGAERYTMRRARFVIRSNAGATAARGAVHTRNTVSMPSKHPSSVSGRVRSPRDTSICGENRVTSGLRVITRTCAPVAANRETTSRPTVPVPPITRI